VRGGGGLEYCEFYFTVSAMYTEKIDMFYQIISLKNSASSSTLI
jgi:hypothetical protein